MPYQNVYNTKSKDNGDDEIIEIFFIKQIKGNVDLDKFNLHPFFVELIKACWNTTLIVRPDPYTISNEVINPVEFFSENLLPSVNIEVVNKYIEKLRQYDKNI